MVEAEGAYVIGGDVAVGQRLRYLGDYAALVWKNKGRACEEESHRKLVG